MATDLEIDREIVEMAISLARGMKANGFNAQEIRYRLKKKFDETEIELALEEIELGEPVPASTVVLRERSEYFGWYNGPRTGQEFHWPRLRAYLANKDNAWTPGMIDSLDTASTTVMSNLAPPLSHKPICVKGLTLGYIQSGKTANFSAVIAKAVDEGYKLIVVLAGMHNNLRRQTELRLREELVNPANGRTCTTLTDVDENGDFKRRQPISANSQLNRKDGFTLVVLKKNSPVLRNFASWLNDASEEVIKQCPTLIIDDEADQASINTNRPENDPTAINNHIRGLIKRFQVASYIGYTATPFANVFISSELSDELYPKDFLVALDKPSTYYGPEELFGRDDITGKGTSDGLPVIRIVPDEDAYALRTSTGQKSGSEVTPSIEAAIHSFLVAGGIRLCRGQWKEHITMLIHFSHLTTPQDIFARQIEKYLSGLRSMVEEDDVSLKRALQEIWFTDYAPTCKKVTGQVDHTFEGIWPNIRKLIDRLEIILDNSQSDERLTFDRSLRDGAPLWGIVIGGNTLSRGLTVEGLTTSYFVRSSKNYDTLLQMGRWFGYRRGYVDVTRIYVSAGLYENFYNLATIEQEIRAEINSMALNGEKPIDVPIRIRQLPGMNITAANKMRTAALSDLTYSGSKIQTHQIVVTDAHLLERNENLIRRLINSAKNSGKHEQPAFSDLNQCHLFRSVPAEAVLQFIEEYEVSENNVKYDKRAIVNYITDCQSVRELTDWSIAVMSLKNGTPITLGSVTAVPLKRNVKHERILDTKQIEATLRAVSTPGEELIDLADRISFAFSNTDDVLHQKGGVTISDIQVRKMLRPSQRGLVLIYPLETVPIQSIETSIHTETQASFPLRAVRQVFGISIVFPYSDSARGSLNYLKNSTVPKY